MSKRAIKSQASSARAASVAFRGAFGQSQGPLRSSSTTFGSAPPSLISYVYEPPDLTGISDPNVVVAFKNVQKKDGTTKTKALEDLQSYVDSSEESGVEEEVLEAWIKVYPRTSIDSSRRVRQLAHNFQGRIATSCGKRLAKYMPDIVASWLAGQQDPDKAVSRAAHDSFNSVFTTEEKSKNVWRVFSQSIVEYVENIFVNETESTLSDTRTTSPDDASSKHARVTGCAVTVLSSLIELIGFADLGKSYTTFANLVNDEALWKLANHNDPFVRRAIYRLLITCLDREPRSLDPSLLSTHFLNKGLHTSQTGSSLDFVKAIVRLSEVIPKVWTSDYQGTGKKSASHRLFHFLRRGSEGGSVNFWSYVPLLLKSIPDQIFHTPAVELDAEHGSEDLDSKMFSVLDAVHAGVSSKDELQTNAAPAWNAYLDICQLVASKMKHSQSQVVQRYLFPLTSQFIRPSPDLPQWTVAGPQQQKTCAKACDIAFRVNPEISIEEWQILSSKIVEDFRTSLPEQSKDYIKSQDLVAAEASRWYGLQAAMIGKPLSELLIRKIGQNLVEEIAAAISILTTRNGKPYGVAKTLLIIMQLMPQIVSDEVSVKKALVDFAEKNVPHLLMSPSGTYLIRLLDAIEDYIDGPFVYAQCLESIEGSLMSSAGQSAMASLLSSPGVAKAGLLSVTADKILARATGDVLHEDSQVNSSILMAALQNPSAPKELIDDILSILTNGLSTEDSIQLSLRVLDFTTKHNRTAFRDFVANSKGSDLIAKLLFLSEGSDIATSQQAKILIKEIENVLETTANTTQNTRPILNAIQRDLRVAGVESLTIESLVSQAERLLKQATEKEMPFTISELLPKLDDWNHALEPFMKRPLNLALALTNPFGTAVTTIQSDSGDPASALPRTVKRDQEGRSVLLRILQYVTKLVKSTELLSKAPEDQKLRLLQYIAFTLQLAGDNISVSGAMPLWVTEDPEIEAETVESIFEAQRLLADSLQASHTSGLAPSVIATLLQNSDGSTSPSYYYARAYLNMVDGLSESKRLTSIPNSADRIKAIRKSSNIFADMAALMSCDTKDAIRPCNELLSDLTDHKFELKYAEGQQDGFRRLLLMNCLLQRSDDIVQEISQQRLIFYVQHVIGEIGAASFEPFVEIVRSLTAILPTIKGIYGSFWGDALDVVKTMRLQPLDDTHLMGYHACFKLCATLAKRSMLEANEDLHDAWADRKQSIMQGAIRLLQEASFSPDETHLPRRILNGLLSRLLEGTGQLLSEETESLFPVLAAESATLQRTAFELLHEQIPLKQKQLSLDKALTKNFEAKIPEELLSLILAPPNESELSESFQDKVPASLRSYLLSWILIFDHWKNASNILQIDYAKSLAEGTYFMDFLNLTFTILIGPGGKLVDISKFEIEVYTANVEPSERAIHSMLSHLYFLCLKYLPIQSKAWWRDTTNRQTNISVESWTQRYVSKHIIASELDTVREWGPSQTDGDQPLTIKVLSSASEITASIPVDEDSMTLAIRLPPSYPLARAEVEGVRRVGVSEKKWISWIRNTQGQLTIASEGGANALIDCLLAWRKNVTATMKGQTECAICYSVVGVDRSLPSKVCKTCKNKFHGSCLFRWFSSSNSSSCPLCRNTFTYS